MKTMGVVSVAGVVLVGAAGIFFGSNFISRAQMQSTSGSAALPVSQNDSIVQVIADSQGLSLVPQDQIPRFGTFWVVYGAQPAVPLPFFPLDRDPASTPLFSLGPDGVFLVDATGGIVPQPNQRLAMLGVSTSSLVQRQVNSLLGLIDQVQESQMNAELDSLFPGDGGGYSSGGDGAVSYSACAINTNGLWLEITNVSNGLAYLNLNNATDSVYEILSKTDLTLTNWNIEQEVWPTNPAVMPFVVSELGRTNLFIWAQDWTGVNINGLPAWWLWTWFGNFYETSNSLDADGNTLQFDYLYGLDPSHVLFSLEFTNQYINTSTTCGTLSVYGGYPYYAAILVNDTNTDDAIWQPFTSTNVPVHFNNGTGTYTIGVGLKGFATNAQPRWQWDTLVCTDIGAVPWNLIVTNPVSGNVSVPVIQLQGLVNRTLSQLTYDVSNALGVVTNQSGYWKASFYDTNLLAFTTNAFQCYDIPLTNGLNTITLHATDWEGNVVTTNVSYTLSYAGVTNVPEISIIWPQSTPVGGGNVTVQAQTDDATAIFYASANGNSVQGLVERNGTVWFQNVPLNAGTNVITITATNAAGNVNTTNLTIVQSSVSLTVNPISSDQLNQSSVNLTGTVSDP